MGFSSWLVEPVVARYPGPVTLRQNDLLRWAFVVCGAAVLFGCIWLIYPGIGDVDPEFDRQDQKVMGVIFSFVALFTIFWGAKDLRRPCTITLDAAGFTMCRGADETGAFHWKDVEHFQLSGKRQGYRVAFDLVSSGRSESDSDWDFLVDDPYGVGNYGLRELLEQWQELALGRPTG